MRFCAMPDEQSPSHRSPLAYEGEEPVATASDQTGASPRCFAGDGFEPSQVPGSVLLGASERSEARFRRLWLEEPSQDG
jgi:hypothetical protein